MLLNASTVPIFYDVTHRVSITSLTFGILMGTYRLLQLRDSISTKVGNGPQEVNGVTKVYADSSPIST